MRHDQTTSSDATTAGGVQLLGRPLATRLGYDRRIVDQLPDRAVESFAGVGNPHAIRALRPGEKVVDLGCGVGFDSFVAARAVGPAGVVVGVDRDADVLDRSRDTAAFLELDNLEFRHAIGGELPVADGWADVVIANGVLHALDEPASVLGHAFRALRPGGSIQFTDVATGWSRSGDLGPGRLAACRPVADWCRFLADAGFVDVSVGPPMDAFVRPDLDGGGRIDVHAHFFLAYKPR